MINVDGFQFWLGRTSKPEEGFLNLLGIETQVGATKVITTPVYVSPDPTPYNLYLRTTHGPRTVWCEIHSTTGGNGTLESKMWMLEDDAQSQIRSTADFHEGFDPIRRPDGKGKMRAESITACIYAKQGQMDASSSAKKGGRAGTKYSYLDPERFPFLAVTFEYKTYDEIEKLRSVPLSTSAFNTPPALEILPQSSVISSQSLAKSSKSARVTHSPHPLNVTQSQKQPPMKKRKYSHISFPEPVRVSTSTEDDSDEEEEEVENLSMEIMQELESLLTARDKAKEAAKAEIQRGIELDTLYWQMQEDKAKRHNEETRINIDELKSSELS